MLSPQSKHLECPAGALTASENPFADLQIEFVVPTLLHYQFQTVVDHFAKIRLLYYFLELDYFAAEIFEKNRSGGK